MKKIKVTAFTLLESLLALLVLVGTFSLFLDMTKIFHEEVKRATTDQTQDWQLFCSLLRSELEGASLDKVENNYLYVRKNVNLRFGLSSKGDFRKTNANGRGYQPMIHYVKNAKISQEGKQVKIILSFEKGGDRIFLYKFSEKES
ncbi:competence type IV pilus minor pilin ComGF [Lactococcus petauri]|uniref:competence type IV pilus minor pilin ComGF n=1 Tax=Lactococcus petauri TaxID=1940789 RepID=UPI002017FD15|nr:competence type IV pilus minor pilin ComGF [Lactococcus petauri]